MRYILVLICFLSFLSYAEQAADQPLSQAQKEPEAQTETTEKQAENTEANADFKTFQPSEDISEDLAVPFPVDI